MDLFHFLDARLSFIEQLYESAVAPFEEIKRKINAHEPPYVDMRNPEDYDEPAFLQEWEQASDSVMVIGHWCLCMVQVTLHAYLEGFTRHPLRWGNPKRLLSELGKKKNKDGNWFECYRLVFLDLGIDWNSGPVPLRIPEDGDQRFRAIVIAIPG